MNGISMVVGYGVPGSCNETFSRYMGSLLLLSHGTNARIDDDSLQSCRRP